MLVPAWTEPVGEAQEVFFVDMVKDRHHGLLDNLVLQCRDAQRPEFAIRLGNVGPPGWLRPVGPSMDLSVKVTQPRFQVDFVLLPSDPVDAGGCLPLEGKEAIPVPPENSVLVDVAALTIIARSKPSP